MSNNSFSGWQHGPGFILAPFQINLNCFFVLVLRPKVCRQDGRLLCKRFTYTSAEVRSLEVDNNRCRETRHKCFAAAMHSLAHSLARGERSSRKCVQMWETVRGLRACYLHGKPGCSPPTLSVQKILSHSSHPAAQLWTRGSPARARMYGGLLNYGRRHLP